MTGALYLVRHAEASGADGDDPGLSDRGRAQARALGDRLAGDRIAGVLHGPSRRAAETAAVLAACVPAVPVAVSPLLADRTPVPIPGERSEYPQRFAAWFDAVPAAERDQGGRALSAALEQLRRVREEASGGALLLVTHAFVVGWFVREVLGGPVWQWLRLAPANAGLTVVRWRTDGTGELVTYNDTGHLTGSTTPT